MCWAVQCDKCGKTTWKGCGRHVEQVMSKVKEEDKCICDKDTQKKSENNGGEQKTVADTVRDL
ncbi:hypothetical protein CPB86DRAFT_702756 [Serendipita vermifera]|nr:hypothetical protein CPB86DRAFT_702756 [Serendipita vermifera]